MQSNKAVLFSSVTLATKFGFPSDISSNWERKISYRSSLEISLQITLSRELWYFCTQSFRTSLTNIWGSEKQ